jgi:hypothetical protein
MRIVADLLRYGRFADGITEILAPGPVDNFPRRKI